MKTKLLCLLALLLSLPLLAQTMALNSKLTSAEPKSVTNVWVTCVTGTNVAGASSSLKYTQATFYGLKASTNNAAPTANTGTVFVGFKDRAGTITTANTPAICDSILAGSYLIHSGPPGTKYDLTDVYFVGATGDKVLIVFEQ